MDVDRNLQCDRSRTLTAITLVKTCVHSQTTKPASRHPSCIFRTSNIVDKNLMPAIRRTSILWSSFLEHDGFRNKVCVSDKCTLFILKSLYKFTYGISKMLKSAFSHTSYSPVLQKVAEHVSSSVCASLGPIRGHSGTETIEVDFLK